MQQTVGQRSPTAAAVFGIALIVLGGGVLLARATGVDIFTAIGAWGWPFFIIVPGLVLLALSLVPARPHGIGLATAGAIVTAVGVLLLYQSRTGHWESWAYAWTLLPAAAGLALMGYGLFADVPGMIRRGLWMAGIAGAIFVAAAWYFERLFAGELDGLDASQWWPIVLVALGAVIVIRGIAFPRQSSPTHATTASPTGTEDAPPAAPPAAA